MDIEQLTKAQIILLTLLVSFVTSIATGIVTVSLVDEAPQGVTQTINRVVEHTVERVASGGNEENGGAAAGSVVTREVQVMVKESDLVTDAVAKVGKSLVRIYRSSGAEGAPRTFISLGVMVSRAGLVATDAREFRPGVEYLVELPDGSTYAAEASEAAGGDGITLLAIVETEEAAETVFLPAALANVSALELGETTVNLSGAERTRVNTGILSDIAMDEGTDLSTFVIADLDTAPTSGAPLVNLLGEVIGLYTGGSAENGVAFTSNVSIKNQMSETSSSSETATTETNEN